MTTFKLHIDPGHAWLEVSPEDLAKVGLAAKDFTRCSYVGCGAFFLEEDCDAPKFLTAWAAEHGSEPRVSELSTGNADSFVRRLAPNMQGKWDPFA